MYKVLILSDTHGLTEEIQILKDRHNQIRHIIHCGDSELAIDAPELEGIIQVAGNCDYGQAFPREKELHIGGLNFLVTHGHHHRVKEHLQSLSYYVEDRDVDLVLYGHNHIASAQKIGHQLFINPGSLRYPRNRVEKTYAIISWEDVSLVEVTFYTIEGEPLPELNFQTNLKK